jgi:hypothetical protein
MSSLLTAKILLVNVRKERREEGKRERKRSCNLDWQQRSTA